MYQKGLFRDLHDEVLPLAVVHPAGEHRLGGQVVVPKVVVRRLEVPLPFACTGIESNDAVPEEILAGSVRSVEIVGRRSGRNQEQSALGIQAHAAPVVRTAGELPAVLSPSVIAKFARVRNGVEDPPPLARADVEGADVPRGGRCGTLAARSASQDQEVFEDYRRAGVVAAGVIGQFTVQALLHVEDAAVCKFLHGLAGIGIQAVHVILCGPGHEDAPILTVGPVRHSAVHAFRAAHPDPLERIEVPEHLPCVRPESPHLHLRRSDVHSAVDDDRCAFDLGGGT